VDENSHKLREYVGNNKNRAVRASIARCDWLFYTHEYQKALSGYEYIRKCWKMNKKLEHEIIESIVYCHIHLSNFSEAVKLIDSLVQIEQKKKKSKLYLLLAEAKLKMGSNRKECISDFQKSITFNNTNVFGWYGLALAYLESSQWHYAIKAFEYTQKIASNTWSGIYDSVNKDVEQKLKIARERSAKIEDSDLSIDKQSFETKWFYKRPPYNFTEGKNFMELDPTQL